MTVVGIVMATPQRRRSGVVLATDLTATSANALRRTAEIGALRGARISAVHASVPLYDGTVADSELGLFVRQHREWRQDVDRRVFQELEQAGIPVERVELTAQPSRPIDAIASVVHRVQPDLLVIGVSRWVMFKRLFIGSVADEVLRSMQCDIMAVPPAAEALREAA